MKGMVFDDSGRDGLSAHHIAGLVDSGQLRRVVLHWFCEMMIEDSDHLDFILIFPRLECRYRSACTEGQVSISAH